MVLRDSEGNELYQTKVNSSVCDDDGLCTVRNIPADFQLEHITVTVTASNVFGESNTTEISVTCVQLTTSNQVLLSLGVILSCIALLGCVILVVLIVNKGKVLCIYHCKPTNLIHWNMHTRLLFLHCSD